MDAFIATKSLAGENLDVVCPEIIFYRVIHLLVEFCNNLISSLLFLFLLACGTAQVMSAVTTILHSSSLNFLLLLFFLMAVSQTFLIYLVVYGFAGEFYRSSDLALLQLKRHIGINGIKIAKKEHKYREKFLRSCQVQKIKFGMSNFIDKTTPLIFQLYCLNRIIDLILVGK